jgi:phosphoenolpyruvate phosphomutase
VPTKYPSTPTHELADAGVSLIIWANHLVRSSISAMQQTAATIFQSQSIAGLESSIATVDEIFRLQNAAELKEAEKRYLPSD